MLNLKGILDHGIFETLYKMIALLQAGLDLNVLTTYRISIDEFIDGFAAIISVKAGKIFAGLGLINTLIVTWGSSSQASDVCASLSANTHLAFKYFQYELRGLGNIL